MTSASGKVMRVQLVPRRFAQKIVGVLLTITDVTSLVQAERQEDQLAALLELSGFVVAVIDSKAAVVAFDKRFAAMCDRDPKHLKGVSVLDMTATEEQSFVQQKIRVCIEGSKWAGILRIILPNGEMRWEVVDFIPGAPSDDHGPTMLFLSRPLEGMLPRGLSRPDPEAEREYWRWDPASDQAHFTPGLSSLWGVGPDSVSLAALSEALTPEARDAMLAAVQEALESGKPTTVRVSVPRDGDPVDLETRMQRHVSERGVVLLVGRTQAVREPQ